MFVFEYLCFRLGQFGQRDKARVISTCPESSTAVALFDTIPFLTASKLFRAKKARFSCRLRASSVKRMLAPDWAPEFFS